MSNELTSLVLPTPTRLDSGAEGLAQDVVDELAHRIGNDPGMSTTRHWYRALGLAIQSRLMERWIASQAAYREAGCKKLYYLSLEFLIGRSLTNAVANLDLDEVSRAAMHQLGLDMETLAEEETEAGLGNGGLGRLAACYLDSLATLGLPGFGYGIRYDYGIFNQRFEADGTQREEANPWLHHHYVWETRRISVTYPVSFGGNLELQESGAVWRPARTIKALAYDIPIPGNNAGTVNHLRLWAARAERPFDLGSFNAGDYPGAVRAQIDAKNLSRILYPDDTTPQGKSLRFCQQYFFVSASLQDILAEYLSEHDDLSGLPDRVAIQLNDTHPALAVPELMRLLIDQHGLDWDDAWSVCRGVFSYTNHTLLPEALETWPHAMFARELPRHLQIVNRINQELLDHVRDCFPGDEARVRRMSLVGENHERHVRMAHLAVVGSHKVNGVAALHSQLMTETIFHDFHEMFPDRFVNVTNGITPRRWLKGANRPLAHLISEHLGNTWENDLDQLQRLAPLADDTGFRDRFAAIKAQNKLELASYIKGQLGLVVNPDSMFDVHIKRIHEYKRQLLNALHVIDRYLRLRAGEDLVPRTVIFSGKAAPGYHVAKRIVRLINNVARVINNDPSVRDRLQVAFLPNYNVTVAEKIIPAAELSQQISTAGMEASGTGNMKLSLNGALTIGTLDGANVEIRDAVGNENIFIFGLTAAEVTSTRTAGYLPENFIGNDPRLRGPLDAIRNGLFSDGHPSEFVDIADMLLSPGEHFLVLADLAAYLDAQARVDEVYADPADWNRKAILNAMAMGHFSSDRSIQEYASNIWNLTPVMPHREALPKSGADASRGDNQ